MSCNLNKWYFAYLTRILLMCSEKLLKGTVSSGFTAEDMRQSGFS